MTKEHYENLTFDQWLRMWYDLEVTLLGEESAQNTWKEKELHNRALKKLWITKGFKTIGEYEEWEKDHIAERNEFLERELNG